jgi:hypothetical protein
MKKNMEMLLVIFKDRNLGTYETYVSLKKFFEQYPQYDELKDKIDLSQEKPYKHVDFELQLINVRM